MVIFQTGVLFGTPGIPYQVYRILDNHSLIYHAYALIQNTDYLILIGDHGKPGVIPPSLIGHPINHLAQATNNTPSITLPQLSVVDAQNAHAAVLTADAVNTLHAFTPPGTVQSLPTVTAGAAQAAAAAAAGVGVNALKPSIPAAAAQSGQKAADGGAAAAIAAANAGAAAGVTSVVNTNGIPTAGNNSTGFTTITISRVPKKVYRLDCVQRCEFNLYKWLIYFNMFF